MECPALTLFNRDVAEVALIVLNPPVSLSQGEVIAHLIQMCNAVDRGKRMLTVLRYFNACSECCCCVVSACHDNLLHKILYVHTVLLTDVGYQGDFKMAVTDK